MTHKLQPDNSHDTPSTLKGGAGLWPEVLGIVIIIAALSGLAAEQFAKVERHTTRKVLVGALKEMQAGQDSFHQTHGHFAGEQNFLNLNLPEHLNLKIELTDMGYRVQAQNRNNPGTICSLSVQQEKPLGLDCRQVTKNH